MILVAHASDIVCPSKGICDGGPRASEVVSQIVFGVAAPKVDIAFEGLGQVSVGVFRPSYVQYTDYIPESIDSTPRCNRSR